MKSVFTFIFFMITTVGLAQQSKSSSASQTIQIRLQKIAFVDADALKSNTAGNTLQPANIPNKWLTTTQKFSTSEKEFTVTSAILAPREDNDANALETTVYTLSPQ